MRKIPGFPLWLGYTRYFSPRLVLNCMISPVNSIVVPLTSITRFALPQGFLTLSRVPKFPRIMSLIAPEVTTDVPRSLEIDAVSGADHIHFCFETQDLAQLIIPNETDLGETTINEAVGVINAAGIIKGQPVDFEGKGFFEFLT